MKNDRLKWFMAGIGIYIFAPVVEDISNWLQSVINSNISQMQMRLEKQQYQHRSECAKIEVPEEQTIHAIGFDTGVKEENYDDEEDY